MTEKTGSSPGLWPVRNDIVAVDNAVTTMLLLADHAL